MIFFIHIEKAGGTSIHNALLTYERNYKVLPPIKKHIGWRYDQESIEKISRYIGTLTFVGGHAVSSIPNIIIQDKKPSYFSFVREPISRYISHVNWIYAKKKNEGIENLLNNSNLDNIQCFRLCGSRNFEDAKRHIIDNDYFIGVMERFDESIYLLSKWLNQSKWIYYSKANKLNKEDKIIRLNQLNEINLNTIIEKNKEDIKLYEFIYNSYYLNQRNLIGFDNNEFIKWKSHNQNFKYSKWLNYKKRFYNFVIRKIMA